MSRIRNEDICFIVASMGDRVHLLNRCINCFLDSENRESDIYLYFQGDNFGDVEHPEAFKAVVIEDQPRGIFTPRYELMKRFGRNYDYVVIIDDDLFVRPDTNYRKAAEFCSKVPYVGCVSLTNWAQSVRNEVSLVSYPEYFNIDGGLVLPKWSVETILDYFKDKEADYTEDMVWLLLWVKGYDLYKDHRSRAYHAMNSKTKSGEFTGYSVVRMTKKYKPILSEWFYDADKPSEDDQARFPLPIFGIKSLRYAKPEAFAERRKNRLKLESEAGRIGENS